MVFVNRFLFFFILISCFLSSPSFSQPKESESQFNVQLSAIKAKIDSIKNKSGVDESLRMRMLDAYYASEDNFEQLISLEQQIKETQQEIKNLPKEIKQFEKKIVKAEFKLKKKVQTNYSKFPIEELEQLLIIEKSKQNELQASINRLAIEVAEHQNQQQQIRAKITEIKNDRITIEQEQRNLVVQVNKQALDANQAQLDSQLRKLNAMLTKLELENIVYPLKEQAQKLELKIFNLQNKQLSENITAIDHLLVFRRQQEIDTVKDELIRTQKDSEGKHPAIQEVYKLNISYHQLLQEVNNKLQNYLDQKNEIDNHYNQLEKDFKSAEQKINLAGLSPALGNLLRGQGRKLPLLKNNQSRFEQVQKEIALASLKLIHLEGINKSLQNTDQVIDARITKVADAQTDETEKLMARTELRTLLINQKDLILKLTLLYSEYSRTLADFDFSLHQLVTLGESFRLYLSQRLLWVPSAPEINLNFFLQVAKSIVWFIDYQHWLDTLQDLKNSIQNNFLLVISTSFIVVLLVVFKKTIKQKMQKLLDNSTKPYVDRFSFTFYGLGYVFLLVLPIPIFLILLGWLLNKDMHASLFSHSVAQGLIAAAIPALTIQFFYRLFRSKGLVESMLYWQESSTQLIYQQLQWFRFVIIPTLFLIYFFNNDSYSLHAQSLGRMALIIAMLALAFLLHRLAHPIKGLAKDFYHENSKRWATRLRYVWYAILVLIPLVIIGFASAGYYQSALELQNKLVILLRLIFFTTLAHEIVMRAMFLANRQLALQNARQKRKLKEQEEGKDNVKDSLINYEEEPLLDIPKINDQSKKLLNVVITLFLIVGSWVALKDILPALSIFDQFVLWQHMAIMEGKETLQPITVVNVFVCFFYIILMLVFVKNFPGLIDLIFAGKYSMVAGSRYALIQLTRYAVVALTIIAIANTLGGSWSQVQWLVAAVSVGLGFGLQEIFANMVSGIILLFERPIRVGDTVTVGDITGKVCRIHMRATTLTDWDHKELIIPNKTFITDKLINWTLTDTVTRLIVPVGISYDSDEGLAKRLLKQVIEETSLVLKEPCPAVYFLGFGDSSLDFELRVFVGDLDDRFALIDELHSRIRRVFKQHNIEIPFPQRDLHIRHAIPMSAV